MTRKIMAKKGLLLSSSVTLIPRLSSRVGLTRFRLELLRNRQERLEGAGGGKGRVVTDSHL